MYADVVDQLQKLVDQQQKSMQEDRQTTAKALDDAQQSFAQSQPTVDQLPAQQQTLAADMQKRLAEINAARAKYSDAAGAVGDGSDETTRKLKEQAASLAASIDLHSKQVADASQSAQRQQEIQEKLAQVASLTQAAKTAEDAYNVKVSDLERAQAAQKAAYAASAEHDALIVRKTPIEKQQDQLLADLSIKQDAVKNSIAPVMITDADIHRATVVDNRMKCAAVTSIPIFLIFSGLILMTIHAASRELPLNALSPSDDGPEPFSLPSYPPNGEPNGAHANGNGSHDEDPNGHSDIEPDVDAEATALNSLSASGDEMDEQDPESQPADAIVQN
jgi:hypothetical protein